MGLPDWTVICFCADWCGTCREYKGILKSISVEYQNVRFGWLDIEDDAGILDGLDIENFPTLMIANDQRVHFFGPLQPHAYNLNQLLARLMSGSNGFANQAFGKYDSLFSRLISTHEIFQELSVK